MLRQSKRVRANSFIFTLYKAVSRASVVTVPVVSLGQSVLIGWGVAVEIVALVVQYNNSIAKRLKDLL